MIYSTNCRTKLFNGELGKVAVFRLLSIISLLGCVCPFTPSLANAGILSICAQALKFESAKEAKAALAWNHQGTEIDVNELRRIYLKSRNSQITYMKNKYKIQIFLKDGVTSLKQAMDSSLITDWTGVWFFLKTPFSEIKKMESAMNFYAEDAKVNKYLGMYISPYSPFFYQKQIILGYDQRPFGVRAVRQSLT